MPIPAYKGNELGLPNSPPKEYNFSMTPDTSGAASTPTDPTTPVATPQPVAESSSTTTLKPEGDLASGTTPSETSTQAQVAPPLTASFPDQTPTPSSQSSDPIGGYLFGAVVVLLVAIGLAVWVASIASSSPGHRVAASAVALLLVLSGGLVVHIGLLMYQSRLPTGRLSLAAANADSDNNVRFRRQGLKAAFVGADGRVSTSKSQVFLWTAFLIAGFAYLLILTRSYPGGTLFTSAVTTNWHPEYLVLVGLPVAAATIAAGAVKGSNRGIGPVSKSDAAAVVANAAQQVPATQLTDTSLSRVQIKTLGSSPRLYMRDPVPDNVRGFLTGLAELVTNDDGTLAWPDLQYTAFTIVTLISFCAQLVANPATGLPPVPAALLTLMGVSSAGYVANKVVAVQGTVPGPT
jgi:hypothetical protein